MKNCIIMGAGRSGTSALAGVMNDSGYHLGEGVLGSDYMNKSGYFESAVINKLNGDIIRATYEQNRDLVQYPDWLAVMPWEQVIADRLDKGKAAAAVLRQPFCFKDPRFSFTFTRWKPVLPKDTVTIVCFRPPYEQMLSVVRGASLQWMKAPQDFETLSRHWASVYQHIFRADDGSFVYLSFDDIVSKRFSKPLSKILDVALNTHHINGGLITVAKNEKIPSGLETTWEELQRRRTICSAE